MRRRWCGCFRRTLFEFWKKKEGLLLAVLVLVLVWVFFFCK